MAILSLKSDEYAIINGWYGKCHDDTGEVVDIVDCPEFDLSGVQDKIRSVYWVESDNTVRSFESGSSVNDFTKLKCGASYLIYLKKGTGTVTIPHFVASYPDKTIEGRITDNCEAAPSSPFSFNVISEIADELDVGYINTDATEYDAENHSSIITKADEVQSINISANGNGIEFSIDGTNWFEITSTGQDITSDFTSLQLRVKVARTSSFTRAIKFIATPVNSAYVAIEKNLNYVVTINNATISASANFTEELEEGSEGGMFSFNISFQNLKGIGLTSTNPSHRIGLSENGNFGDGISIPNPSASPVKIYVKLHGNMPDSDVTSKFNVIGERRNSGPFITLTDAVTITSTVAPRPQITSLSVNPTTLDVSISFSNRNNYGGHHWHYDVKKKSDNSTIVSTQMPGFDQSVTLNQSDFTEATTFVLTAFIVTQSHVSISGSDTKTTEFTVNANNATLSLSTNEINEVIDVDKTQANHSVTIASNNLTNITLSPSSLTNWEIVSQSSSSFIVKIKNSSKTLQSSGAYKTLPQETITITGDVGDRDTSGDAQKSKTLTLDGKIVDDAEFVVTPPGGQGYTINDTRNYGTSSVEFGSYTISGDAVNVSASTLTHWEVELNDSGTWTKNPVFTGEGTSTFKLRQPETSVGSSYNDVLVITPSAKSSDHDSSNDPSAYTITLNGKINPLVATLNDPDTQTLNTITSGQSPASKSFTVTGNRIENITISEVSSGWSVTPSSPSLNGTVTISYTGDAVSAGVKTGSFKISASAITGSVLSVSEYTVNLSLTVNSKIAEMSKTPNSISLNAITSGDSSDTKTLNIQSNNVDDIKITSIPSGFIVKNGNVTLSENTSISKFAILTISISDTDTLGSISGSIVFTGTPSANSVFSNSNTISVAVSAQVNGQATALDVTPKTITDSVNQYGALPSPQKITLTQTNLQSVVVSGGNGNRYQVSKTSGGSYASSITLDSDATEFWVKLMSTSSSSNVSTTLTVSGTKNSIGANNPSNKTISCVATTTAFTASVTLSPTSITETYDQNATTTAQQVNVTLDDISSLRITASSKYSVSETENGTFNSGPLTLSNPGASASFFVKCNDTSAVGSATGTITVVGTHTLGGGSTTKTLSCSATINEVDTGGGDGDCCDGRVVVTAGNNANGVSLSNESALGTGGRLCFNSLNTTSGATKTFHCVLASDTTQYIGAVALSLADAENAIENQEFFYIASNGDSYKASFAGIADQQWPGPQFVPHSCGTPVVEDCCDGLTSVTAGNNANGVSLSNESALGTGGTLCFESLNTTSGATKTFHCVLASDTTQYIGAVALSLADAENAIKNKKFIYKTKDGVCYEADFTGIADQQWPGPQFSPIS